MTAIVLISVINHYHTNGLHLFSDTLYLEVEVVVAFLLSIYDYPIIHPT